MIERSGGRAVGFRRFLALLALVAVGLRFAPAVDAQVSGQGFLLSKRADFASDDRVFTRGDTLYMRVWSDRVDLTRALKSQLWRLDSGSAGVKQNLTKNANGTFTASFRLADLPSSSTAWSWKARLEDRRGKVYTPAADITVQAAVAPPVANFGAAPTSGTAPLAVAFTELSTGAPTAWAWDFGDGTSSTLRNPTHAYASPGTFSVRLTATNAGGSNSLLRTGLVSVAPPVPSAALGASPTSGTAPLSVAFADLSSGWPNAWAWDFGDGASSTVQSPTHVYASPGSYSVRLTATNATGSSSVVSTGLVTVAPPAPSAALEASPTSGTAPLSVAFADRSSGWPSAWAWDFGDGASSTLQNPTHVYASPGTYSVRLTVTNSAGSSSALCTELVSVAPPPPSADLSASPTDGAAPLGVAFVDLSSGWPAAWAWDFGDGESSTLQNPTHVYSSPGTYSVQLTVTNATGSSSAVRSDLVHVRVPAPLADFGAGPTKGTAPLTVAFVDLSGGSTTSWSWAFGDGASSTLQHPTHEYASPGTYSVAFTATNAGGSSSLVRTDLVSAVPPLPSADLAVSPSSGPAPLDVAFADLSSGWPTAWSWEFGDGASSTEQNPTHRYASPGIYGVTLTVANGTGSSSVLRTELVTAELPTPVADLSASQTAGPAPLSVDFADLSSGWPGAWAWDFGDGASSTEQHPTHEYASPGSYSVTLTVTNAAGSSSSSWPDLVSVLTPPPIAALAADPTSGRAPLSVTFADLSSGSPTSWSWDFGDGASSTEQHPVHAYTSPGTYSVALTATNAGGPSSVLFTDLVSVAPPAPVADLAASPTSGVAPLSVVFADLSSGWPTAWSWDFGDGATSALQNPTHAYTSPGTYSVTLVASNESGVATCTRPELVTVEAAVFAIAYGMNASENVWSQRGIAFADAMARASEFCTVDGAITASLCPLIPLGRSPALLGEGWPDFAALPAGQKAGARLFGNMKGTMPDGRVLPYVLTWEGTGACRLSGPSVVSEANRGTNRVEVFVDPSAGGANSALIWIIDSSSPTDPVRNAHVWLPGTESEKPILWAPFVAKLQAMNDGRGPHTWRTMDWSQVRQYGRTDGAAPFVFDLAGRITTRSPSQGTRRGVCPEFHVALCNAVGANLHFNVPHQANGISDADYAAFVREALLAIRDGSPAVPGINGGRPFAGLDPELVLTLEYSNELWNGGFTVNAWLKYRATSSGRTLHQQIAFEIQRVFAIADEVFAGPDAPRLRKYVGGWIGDPTFLQKVLDALGHSQRIDAVGPACYFGPRPEDVNAWMAGASGNGCPNCPTPEQVVESARLAIPGLRSKLREHRLLADAFLNTDGSSPALELYEAGQAFIANLQPWKTAAVQAQSIPTMYEAYVLDLIPMLVDERVDLVNWYSFVSDNSASGSGAGPFGHWDNMNQSITLPVREPYLHEGVPKAAAIYKAPPTR